MFKKASTILPLKSVLFKNSIWGIISHMSQTIFVSAFFVILARKFSVGEFADYIIATTLYQLVSAFSSLGLSQWFIREISGATDKNELVTKFLKLQFIFGVLFYFINVSLAYAIYDDDLIRMLSILFGANIAFDNIINAIKSLNIAEFAQKKTFWILTLEAFLKLLGACLMFVYPFSILVLSVIVIALRFITLNLFLKMGSSSLINVKAIWRYRISFADVRRLLFLNWPFIIIGGTSIVNWRIANIIISKTLTAADVANYEISYKVFSIAQILPVIISASVFPTLIRLFRQGDKVEFKAFYHKVYLYFLLFGLLSYTFIYTFGSYFIPLAFGPQYLQTAVYTKQMFLTILVFPTALLQANMIVAMKFEKLDMWYNVINLLLNLVFCIAGVYLFKSLTAINVSVFLGFVCFHILQDITLVKKGISTAKHVVETYLITLIFILAFLVLTRYFNNTLVFFGSWLLLICWLARTGKLDFIFQKLNFNSKENMEARA